MWKSSFARLLLVVGAVVVLALVLSRSASVPVPEAPEPTVVATVPEPANCGPDDPQCITQPGWVGCASIEALKAIMEIRDGGDREAIARQLASDDRCVVLKPGLTVRIDGTPAMGIRKVRVVGDPQPIYVEPEALAPQ